MNCLLGGAGLEGGRSFSCFSVCIEGNDYSSSAIAETVLQGGLVMASGGRLELKDDILRTL